MFWAETKIGSLERSLEIGQCKTQTVDCRGKFETWVKILKMWHMRNFCREIMSMLNYLGRKKPITIAG